MDTPLNDTSPMRRVQVSGVQRIYDPLTDTTHVAPFAFTYLQPIDEPLLTVDCVRPTQAEKTNA